MLGIMGMKFFMGFYNLSCFKQCELKFRRNCHKFGKRGFNSFKNYKKFFSKKIPKKWEEFA